MTDKIRLEKLLNYVKAKILLENDYRSSPSRRAAGGLLADEFHRGRLVILETILFKAEQLEKGETDE